MLRVSTFTLLSILVFSFSTANAGTYTWTDEQGTMHFTEDLGSVPEKIRNRTRKVEEVESAQEEKSPLQTPSAKIPVTTSQPILSAGDSDEVHAGKTYAQWQRELVERETAMTAVLNRIDEVAALRNNLAASRAERDRLFAEHSTLLDQFKEMKKQYYEQVEIARKAGLTINIQQ